MFTTTSGKGRKCTEFYSDTPKSGYEAEILLANLKITLLQEHPFFGKILFKMPFIEMNMFPTTAIDARARFYFNRKWVNYWTRKDGLFELGHEVLHVLFRCFSRKPEGASNATWNIAADYVNDTVLIEAGFTPSEVSEIMVPPEIQAKVKELGYAHEPVYRWLLEQPGEEGECQACKMLAKMVKEASKQEDQALQKQNDATKAASENSEEGAEKSNDDGNGSNGEEGNNADAHSHSCGGDDNCSCGENMPDHTCGNIRHCAGGITIEADASPEDIQKWKEIVIEAKLYADSKDKGNLPGILNECINSLTTSTVRWQDYLRSRSTQIFNRGEYTYNRQNRRGHAMGIRLPGRKPEGKAAACCIDTSGSMSEEEVIQCFTETAAIMKQSGAAKIYLILHDHPVYWAGEVTANSLTNLKMSRGGTSHIEVFKVLTGNSQEWPLPVNEKIEMAVCFTDLGTSFPDQAPPFEVIWGVVPGYGEQVAVPFGYKVNVKLAGRTE
jgi:predicted metal-dependent peptidase